MSKSNEFVEIKVPKQFRELLDKRRMEAGYNNRERAKFLRDICKEADPFEQLKGQKINIKVRKNTERGGIDFGF